MPEKHAMDVGPTSMAKLLIATLGEAQVLQVARESRWLRRLRDITPLALVVACLSRNTGAAWTAAALKRGSIGPSFVSDRLICFRSSWV